jgi:predicted ester cyclase
MERAELEALGLRAWELFNARDTDEILANLADDYVNHNALPGTPPGPEGQREVNQRLWSAFPDLEFEVEDMLVADDRVAVIGMMRGTHRGEFMGIKPTNKRFEARQMHRLRFNDEGKLT